MLPRLKKVDICVCAVTHEGYSIYILIPELSIHFVMLGFQKTPETFCILIPGFLVGHFNCGTDLPKYVRDLLHTDSGVSCRTFQLWY